MKFNKELIDYLGNVACACIADIVVENKMPQIVLSTGIEPKQIRMVMLNNDSKQMSKEEIVERLKALKAIPGKDVGFSYTQDGVRVICVPEEMSIHPVMGAPLGTPRG